MKIQLLKTLNLFALLALTSTCTSLSKKCTQTAAGLDIGSGSTRLLVAEVNVCTKKIIKTVEEKKAKIDFYSALGENSTFSDNFIKESTQQINELITAAKKLSPEKINVSATEAFRVSKNSKQFLEKLNLKVNFNEVILDQKKEAQLGYEAAKIVAGIEGNKTITWDIGGGSMQISFKDLDNQWYFHFPKIASVVFKDMILERRGTPQKNSPNPIYLSEATRLKESLKKEFSLNTFPAPIKKLLLSKNKLVIGLGGVHAYSVLGQVKEFFPEVESAFTQEQVNVTLFKRLNLKDSEISSEYKETEISNLVLVYSLMQAWNIKKVQTVKANLSTALLFR